LRTRRLSALAESSAAPAPGVAAGSCATRVRNRASSGPNVELPSAARGQSGSRQRAAQNTRVDGLDRERRRGTPGLPRTYPVVAGLNRKLSTASPTGAGDRQGPGHARSAAQPREPRPNTSLRLCDHEIRGSRADTADSLRGSHLTRGRRARSARALSSAASGRCHPVCAHAIVRTLPEC